MKKIQILIWIASLLIPSICFAQEAVCIKQHVMHVASSGPAIFALIIFILAYILVISEEFIDLRKSKPVVFASGIIWLIVAILAHKKGLGHIVNGAIKYSILEYSELFLFLMVAMTYINAMEERKVFESIQFWLVSKKLSLKTLFWATGILTFFMSPIADNLTSALVMCSVLMAVGRNNKKFISLGCINIVVAANAGGAFSPFGDLTTLMVWTQGILPFATFFKIFLPAIISYAVPAFFMSLAIPNIKPRIPNEKVELQLGAKRIVFLFLLTILTAICFHHFLHLPAAAGMMVGLSYLKIFGFYLKKYYNKKIKARLQHENHLPEIIPFDIIKKIERIEWDTLLFFYGVMLCIGGLSTLGYLEILQNAMYNELNIGLSAIHQHTPANIILGILSAVIDNIPVMFSILSMHPIMSEGQWLLVTLSTGIGGSLLSVGSAAGVALMGQSKGSYTFFSHLKWSWIILIGFLAGIGTHLLLNHGSFTAPI